MKSKFTILAILFLGSLGIVHTSTTPIADDPQQERRQLAATELRPIVLDAYAKDKNNLERTMSATSVSFTVAVRRYDPSYALVALAINTDDPAILAEVPTLELNVQPVELVNGKISRAVGTSTTGQMKAPSVPSTTSTIYGASFPATAPEQANAINVGMTLVGKAGSQGLNFVITLGNETHAGTAARGSILTSVGSGNRSASIYQRVAYKNIGAGLPLAKPALRDCNCVPISITCGTATCSTNCRTCEHNPTVTCNCDQSGCGCGILCDSCH
jgi:hypothetical protein